MPAAIYLDHASQSPMAPTVLAAMTEVAARAWGNPAAVHGYGRRARAALADAAADIADFLGCPPGQLRWASNATQGLRWAIELAAERVEGPIVGVEIDHPAVVERLRADDLAGRVRWLEAPGGAIDLDAAKSVLADAAVVVCSPLNHELGTRVPASILGLAPEAIWILDAVQAAVWLELEPYLGARCLVVAASAKLGGPPGAAVVRTPPELDSFAEPWHRAVAAGTIPWLALIGMGAACAGRREQRDAARLRASVLGNQLLSGLRAIAPDLQHNGEGEAWLGPIVNVSIPGVDARRLEHELDLAGLAIARTSACRARLDGGSPVVAAAYPDAPARAEQATRWSLGWTTTSADIDAALELAEPAIRRLRADW